MIYTEWNERMFKEIFTFVSRNLIYLKNFIYHIIVLYNRFIVLKKFEKVVQRILFSLWALESKLPTKNKSNTYINREILFNFCP